MSKEKKPSEPKEYRKPENAGAGRDRARKAEDRLLEADKKGLIDWSQFSERAKKIITDIRLEKGESKGLDVIGPSQRRLKDYLDK